MAGFCAKCGNPIKDGDRFCSVCGTPAAQNNIPAVQQPAVQNAPPAARPQAFQNNMPPAYGNVYAPNNGGGKRGGSKTAAIVVGVVCGVVVLGIAAAAALFFLGFLNFGPFSGDEGVSPSSIGGPETSSDLPASFSAAAGEDPDFDYLRGLDMTFEELATDGYDFGEEYDSGRTYLFRSFGQEAGFVFAGPGPEVRSQPLGLVTTLDNIFPEMCGLSAEEAGKLYSPCFDAQAEGGCVYETDSYIFTIMTSGILDGEDAVYVVKRGTAVPEESPSPELSPTSEPTPEAVESDFYILPQSSQRLLTYVDIQNFTKQDMMLARNEIFARHGRKFKDEDVRTYFESQSWYKGTVEPEDFSTAVFTEIEQKNVEFLKQYEDGLNGISQNVGNSGSVVTYSGYMIPQSSSRRLTYADIAGLSSWQLSMARNEIYARHGRMFNDPDIRSYFQAQSWYNGYIAPENFDSSVLSDTEVYNIEFIKSYE